MLATETGNIKFHSTVVRWPSLDIHIKWTKYPRQKTLRTFETPFLLDYYIFRSFNYFDKELIHDFVNTHLHYPYFCNCQRYIKVKHFEEINFFEDRPNKTKGFLTFFKICPTICNDNIYKTSITGIKFHFWRGIVKIHTSRI